MEKSTLLKLYFSQCEKESIRPTANNFFSFLLTVLTNEDKSVFTYEMRKEMEHIAQMIPIGKESVKKSHELKKLNEDFLEPFMFEKYIAMAEKNASSVVSADDLLKIILETPTPEIKAYLNEVKDDGTFTSPIKKKTEDEMPGFTDLFSDATKRKEPTPSTRMSLSDLLKTIDDGDDDKPDEPTETEQPSTHPISNRLSELIREVKRVRKLLKENIFGQDTAILTFLEGYYQGELSAELRPERVKPRATFLFAGPPGVGKTFLSEQVAKALDRPFMRFDMSEYSTKEANLALCGFERTYKDSKPGALTNFVDENPNSILLFDEIEKADPGVINLFLQLLDAGRLRDNYKEKEVEFKDTIVILTTNAGKQLYEESETDRLSDLPRKTILSAISDDKRPGTNEPMFPRAICSRFAAGNVVMFNKLPPCHLLKIIDSEVSKNTKAFNQRFNIDLTLDSNVPFAILFAEGGKTDARTVRGRSADFFYKETYELFRLINDKKEMGQLKHGVDALKSIQFTVSISERSAEISKLFAHNHETELLIFASERMQAICEEKFPDLTVHYASDLEKAKEILKLHKCSLILCDLSCGVRNDRTNVLNVEDMNSEGRDFFLYATSQTNKPIYLLEEREGKIGDEELLSFVKNGACGCIAMHGDKDAQALVKEICENAYQQTKLTDLMKSGKTLSYETSQTITEDGTSATITLFDLSLKTAIDSADTKNIVADISRPNLSFADVIGAHDAKTELKYFAEYLKDPAAYMAKGVKAPKGILLYGPPGTGKTLLAKAMAGESDVTYIATEGNSFLKRYVGEGAESVHELFRTARKYAPSILFIDEIDAIAKNRMTDTESHTGDVLTAFLTEMDGFANKNSQNPVFILAATNYSVDPSSPQGLDAAILRRFDRRILIDLPNKDDRKRYLKMQIAKHSNMHLSEEAIENIANRSTGMSLAQLESVIEFSLRESIKAKDCVIDDVFFENVFESFNYGEEKKWDEKELIRTARHEAGHALLCWLSGEKPSYLTIVARGDHGGYMQHANNERKGSYTKEDLLAKVRTAYGGRAAELVYYPDESGLSTGPSGDIESATRIATHMVCSYGMDEVIGPAAIDVDKIMLSPYYPIVRERINKILNEQMEEAVKIIRSHKNAIDAIVSELLIKNHLKEDEIDAIFSANT